MSKRIPVAHASRAGFTAGAAEAIGNTLSEGLFAGMLDFKKLPFNWDTLTLRLTVALGILPPGDHCDQDAICAWAGNLKPMLG